jgi:hypothetical protein
VRDYLFAPDQRVAALLNFCFDYSTTLLLTGSSCDRAKQIRRDSRRTEASLWGMYENEMSDWPQSRAVQPLPGAYRTPPAGNPRWLCDVLIVKGHDRRACDMVRRIVCHDTFGQLLMDTQADAVAYIARLTQDGVKRPTMLVLRARIVLRGAREQFSSLAVVPTFDSLDPATRIGVVEDEPADADDAEEAEPDDMLMDSGRTRKWPSRTRTRRSLLGRRGVHAHGNVRAAGRAQLHPRPQAADPHRPCLAIPAFSMKRGDAVEFPCCPPTARALACMDPSSFFIPALTLSPTRCSTCPRPLRALPPPRQARTGSR